MSPVHVIVGEDARAEAMWANAFTGAVDLYRFPRNVDAFERLTAAEAPVDLVVLTPAQDGPFNLTPDQFIARVLEGPLGQSRFLQNLHVIVVGSPVTRTHPRVMAVSTLDAAIRLVKFGEVERAPRPAAMDAAPPVAGTPRVDIESIIGDSQFSSSIISRIWDAPDPTPARAADDAQAPREAQRAPREERAVEGGGAGRAAAPVMPAEVIAQAPAGPAQLFTRVSVPGLVVGSSAPVAAAPTAPSVPAAADMVTGGGAPAVVGAPGEAIEVATGLQPARPYQLPNGAGYRGPAVRGGQVNAASHDAGGQPVPPALASQVQAMVYGPAVGNPHDPILIWTSTAREAAAPVPGAPVQTMPSVPAAPAGVAPQAGPVAVGVQPAAPRIVPMDPPPGAYGMPVAGMPGAPAAAPAASPMAAADPFLARAEQGGGDVAFG